LADDFHYVVDSLRVIYSGVLTGELIRDKFIPAHALAMSTCMKKNIPRIGLNYEESIRYLQRKMPAIPGEEKGWQVVTYNEYVLGWINVLTGRINNYYPKELRIIKDN
jgi:NOL1/NOP2/fmu family ribosome biogenesis protein